MGGSNSCALKTKLPGFNVQKTPRQSTDNQLGSSYTESHESFKQTTQNEYYKSVDRLKENNSTVFKPFDSPKHSHLDEKSSERLIEIYGPNSLMDQYISGSNVFNNTLEKQQNVQSINGSNDFSDTQEIHEMKPSKIPKEKPPPSCPKPCNCCGRYHKISHTSSPSNNQSKTPQRQKISDIQFCCICHNMHEIQDDSSECSERSKQIEYVDLPYQKTDLYQQLMRELEETIQKRNKQRQERERLFKQNHTCSCSRCENNRRNYGCFCRNNCCNCPTSRYRNNHQNTMYYP